MIPAFPCFPGERPVNPLKSPFFRVATESPEGLYFISPRGLTQGRSFRKVFFTSREPCSRSNRSSTRVKGDYPGFRPGIHREEYLCRIF